MKSRERSFLLFALASLVLSACATTQYRWYHNQLTGQAAQQQFVLDRGACTTAAYRAVGAPPASQTTPSPLYGAAAGIQQAERENQYQAAFMNVFSGCMAERGWTLRAITR